MASPTATPKKVPVTLLLVSAVFFAALIAGLVYLSRPVAPKSPPGPSREATAYLPSLALSDVEMKATENFMKQQVVEVVGKITNNGPRTIQRIEVYCIFKGIDGQEVYRERVPVVQATAQGRLHPKQTQSFRLPFDALPESWNQAMPNLVIAQIVFAK
jgi:hypothetical protein